MRRLASILTESGVYLTGWALSSARNVSADGTVITGFRTHNSNQEAFVAVIPEPASLALLATAAGGCCRPRRRR